MNDGDLERTLVGKAQLSVDGIYTHRLRQQLIHAGVKLGLDHLTDDLLSAQRGGLLGFRARRWCTPLPLPDPIFEGESELFGDGSERVLDSTQRVLRAIPAQLLSGNVTLGSEEPEQMEPSQTNGTWQVFSKLAEHYIECLRLGAASRASHDADKHERQFHILRLNARWWPDAAGARSLRIARKDLGAEFLAGLAKRTRDPILIGYPLSVAFLPADNTFLVTPMSILQCDARIDGGALTITPRTAIPVLNPDWVRKRGNRKDFRTALRRLVEFTENDDNEISLAGREGWSDLQQMAQMTASLLPNDCADPLIPQNTQGGLHLRTIDQLQNCVGLFLISENNYTKGSQSDLRSIVSNDGIDIRETALSGFFANDTSEVEEVPVSAPFELSEDQFLAVRGALTKKITVISGPPGTGKSQVVASILVSAAMSGKSVLFSSHTHKAIDAVQDRVDNLTPDRRFLMRVGGEEQEGKVDFKSAINALIANLQDSNNDSAQYNSMARAKQLNDEIGAILRLSDDVSELTSDLGACWTERFERERRENENNMAQDVSIVKVKGSLIGRILREFLHWLTSVLSINIATHMQPKDMSSPELSIAQLDRRIADIEAKHKIAVAALNDKGTPEELANKIITLRECAEKGLVEFLPTLEMTTPEHRLRLTELQGAIGLATSRPEKLEVWKNYANAIISHFPVWSGTALSIPSRIPMVPALFDYVIIDEATTCNIAQAIPLLARARQAIIVGDKMQTGMVSDLEPSRERELLTDIGLGAAEFAKYAFSQVSLFDLANSLPSAGRHILRDHFRCDPQIAEFISSTFYGGRLIVRTDQSSLKPPKGTRTGLHWTDIIGSIDGKGKGGRSENEALAIVEEVTKLIRDQNYKGTIGVVTPFQRQAQLIASELERRLSYEERTSASLVVGTSHKFQGDDRDIVMVSLCYGPSMPRGSDWFLRNNTDWLNVAISRARAVCHIFGDHDACSKSTIRHIARLVRYATDSKSSEVNDLPVFDSPWERALYEALVKADIKPITQYPLAGRRLDLAVLSNNIKLDVEVDGDTYHRDRDGFRKVSDLWRDHVVTSLGWKVRRFWVYELKDDMGACVEQVKRDIDGK